MAKRNFYIPVETYSVLLSSTKSQEAAKTRHILKESYGVPEMFKDFGHGAGKAYSEMSYKEKVVYGLALFAVLGVVADNVAYDGKHTTKPAKDKLDKVYEKIVKKTPAVVIGADSVNPLAPTPAPTVMANGSAEGKATPEKPFLMYDGIKIIGDEQFQKDVMMTYEFAKKYSPEDYNLISKHKWVESSDVIKTAGAGGDGFSWGKKRLREMIENKKIIDAVGTALHEYGHNTVWNTKERTNETYANTFAFKGRENLSYVNQSEIDKFYQEFDFSDFKK